MGYAVGKGCSRTSSSPTHTVGTRSVDRIAYASGWMVFSFCAHANPSIKSDFPPVPVCFNKWNIWRLVGLDDNLWV